MTAAPHRAGLGWAAVLLVGFGAIELDLHGAVGVDVLGQPLTLSKLAGVALIGLGAWLVARERRLVATVPVAGWLAAYLALAALTAIDAPVPRAAASRLLSLAGHGLVMLAVAQIATRASWRALWIGGAAVSGALLVHGLADAAWQLSQAHDPVDAAYLARGSGTFGNPVEWVGALLLTLPAWIVGLRGQPGRGASLARGALLGGLVVALLAARSRIGLIVGLPTAAVVAWLLRADRVALGSAALLGVAGWAWFHVPDVDALRFAAIVDPDVEQAVGHGSMTVRRQLLAAHWTLWTSSPWLGIGIGQFPSQSLPLHASEIEHWPHSTPLGVLTETGVVGLAVFTGFVVAAARRVGAGLGQGTGLRVDVRLGLALSLLAAAGISLVAEVWYRPTGWFMLGIGLAAAARADADADADA